MTTTSSTRAVRIFLLLAFLFVFFVSLMPPATEYERTVYFGTPTWLLALFYGILVFGAALLARQSLKYNSRQTYAVCIGMLVAFFGFFYIPFARGYFLNSGYKADTLHHLGVVKDILRTGEIQTLTYPATHNFITTIHLLTDIQINYLPWLISFIFFALFIIAIAVSTRTMSRNRKIAVLVVLASFTMLFAKYRYEVMPWMYAVPFIFFLTIVAKDYLDSSRYAWLLMFMVVSTALTVYHPFTAVYGGIFLFSYLLVMVADEDSALSFGKVSALPFIFGAILFSYHFFFETITGALASALTELFASDGGGPGAQAASQASIFDYTPYQFLSRFILPIWGDILYYLLAGGIATLLILFAWYSHTRSLPSFEKFLASQYILGGVMGGVLLVTGFFGISIRRVTQYGILISILLVGVGLYKISIVLQARLNDRRPMIVVGVIVILIAPVLVGSAATMYAPDRHVTHKAAAGSDWQFENTNLERPYIGDPYGRISRFHLGISEFRQLQGEGYHLRPMRGHPDRLGYGENQTISTSLDINESVYMVTKTRDRKWYRWEPEWRWQDLRFYTDSDYERLKNDPTARRVYSNGGYDIWVIEPT